VCRNSEKPAAFQEAGGTPSVTSTFRKGNQLITDSRLEHKLFLRACSLPPMELIVHGISGAHWRR
jgi:hypothetical protein